VRQEACLADQPRGLGERADRDRAVVGGHAAELVTRDEGRFRAQVSGAERGHHPCRASSNHDNV
jgi:hypothetical protein